MNRCKSILSIVAAAALTLAGCATGGKQEHAARLPAEVKAGFDKAYPGATIQEVEKETYKDGTVHWEVKFTDKSGKTQEIELDSAGKVLGEH